MKRLFNIKSLASILLVCVAAFIVATLFGAITAAAGAVYAVGTVVAGEAGFQLKIWKLLRARVTLG